MRTRSGVHRTVRPKTKRKRCAHCDRYRLRKFIEWHPGIFEWQCSDFGGCDEVIADRDARKRVAATYGGSRRRL